MTMMLVDRACPLCGSRDQNEVIRPDIDPAQLDDHELHHYWTGFRKERIFFPYSRCSTCGMLYSKKYLSEALLSNLYAAMAENMAAAGSENTASTQKSYVSLVEPYIGNAGDYLEIGPDVGVFAKECATRNLIAANAWLIEPNREVWERLLEIEQLGKMVYVLPSLEALDDIPPGTVALAVGVHVVDHLLDPTSLLKKVRVTLRGDGLVFLVCHNERSLLSRLLGCRWPAYCLQHPHLFSPRSLRALLDRAGFDLLEIRRTTNTFSVHFLVDTFLKVVFGVSMPRLEAMDRLVVSLPLGNIAAVAKRRD
jgi:hypothetical protein